MDIKFIKRITSRQPNEIAMRPQQSQLEIISRTTYSEYLSGVEGLTEDLINVSQSTIQRSIYLSEKHFTKSQNL